jgi:hypothetical protein
MPECHRSADACEFQHDADDQADFIHWFPNLLFILRDEPVENVRLRMHVHPLGPSLSTLSHAVLFIMWF